MFSKQSLATACLLSVATALTTDAEWFYPGTRPFVIGHRGSFGHFPEHCLGGYTDAWLMGADWIEFDLNMSRDGTLIIQHDSCLSKTTNAAEMWDNDPTYSDRKTTYELYPSQDTCTDDYSVPLFDLDELKQLKRKQRYTNRSQLYNDMFELLTLEEGIQWMVDMNANYTREIGSSQPGLYIELKDSKWYWDEHQMDLPTALYEGLQAFGLETVEKATAAGIPVIVQSFEPEALVQFAALGSDLPLILLMYWQREFAPDYSDFDAIADICHGVGPNSDWLMHYPNNTDSGKTNATLTGQSQFIDDMHDRGLQVHPYTLQDDMPKYTDNGVTENELYLEKGVDGMFTEFVHGTYQIFEAATMQYNTISEFKSEEM